MPDDCVVDTDVVSYVFRGDTHANLFRPHVASGYLAISFMTLAELTLWTLQHN